MRFLAGFVVCLPLSTLWAQQYVISTVAGGSPAPASAAATSVALGQPGRVALDPAGNVYFTALNSVFRLDGSGNAVFLEEHAILRSRSFQNVEAVFAKPLDGFFIRALLWFLCHIHL